MAIKINAKNRSERVEIMRVGNFERRFEEDLKITLLDLQKMKQNFESNARRQKLNVNAGPVLPFNFGHHGREEAAGWITSLEIGKDSDNFDALFASVDWTPLAAQKIRDNEFKFVSSEFTHNFKDRETGKIYDVILGGAALTNIPFIRDMEAVNLLSEKGSGQMTIMSLKLSGDNPDINFNQGANMPTELGEKFNSLSPEEKAAFLTECEIKSGDDKKLSEELESLKKDKKKSDANLKLAEEKSKKLEADMSGSSDAGDKLKLAEGEIGKLKTQVGSLTKTMAEDKRKSEFDQMLSEGKVCEAQRKPFMENNFIEYAEKMQEVKLGEKGAGSKGDEEGGDELEKAERKVEKLAEEKMEKDENLDFGDATSLVLSENPKLAAAVN